MKPPLFLQHSKLTAEDILRLSPYMANWLKAYAYTRTLKPDAVGVNEVGLMLLHELSYGRRLHVIQRLRGRFTNLRNQYEDQQMFSVIQAQQHEGRNDHR